MFLVRLQNFDPLVDATSLFAQIAKDADVKFLPSMFSIIASNPSPRFVATLQMSHRFFTNYSVNQNHSSKICLESLHDAMLDGSTCSAMTIHLLENLHKMTLRFETPENVAPLHHELTLSPAQGEDLGQVEYGKFFILNSKELRRIIKELPLFQDDSVCVTVTNSQIKFAIGLKEIILTKEGGNCKIVGFDAEVETQLQIILRPMMFFLNLTYKANRVWFYKTLNSHSVISVPAYGLYGQYVIHFPLI